MPDMARVDGVVSVHDLHAWSLTSRRIALSAHVVVACMDSWERVLEALRDVLRHNYAIEHVTLCNRNRRPGRWCTGRGRRLPESRLLSGTR